MNINSVTIKIIINVITKFLTKRRKETKRMTFEGLVEETLINKNKRGKQKDKYVQYKSCSISSRVRPYREDSYSSLSRTASAASGATLLRNTSLHSANRFVGLWCLWSWARRFWFPSAKRQRSVSLVVLLHVSRWEQLTQGCRGLPLQQAKRVQKRWSRAGVTRAVPVAVSFFILGIFQLAYFQYALYQSLQVVAGGHLRLITFLYLQ